MRFVIYGAGAVGGVIGARLHEHGHDVVLIARGAQLEAIRERGLCLIRPEGRSVHELTAVGHPSEVGLREGDVVLLSMKTQHTASALEDLRACTALELPIVCAQNGVENERLAARLFEHVYGMLVWLPSSFLEPGEVVAFSSPTTGLLDAGCYPRGTDACIEAVTRAIDTSGFAARAEPAIMRWKYNKLLSNVLNALMAVLGTGGRGYRALEGGLADFAARVRAEALACYSAAGIDCASEAEEATRRKAAGVEILPVEGQRPTAGSSWQSLARGVGSIETDFLNGEIVLLGRLHGVPTPCNRALQLAANRMALRREQPGSVSLEELEKLATP
jgi:2-dehydropantoate 2-reductase